MPPEASFSRSLACASVRPTTRRMSLSWASREPPGKTYAPPRNAAFCVRCSMRTSIPSRSRISVAAGRGTRGPDTITPSGRAAGAVLVVGGLDHRAHALPVGVAQLVERDVVAGSAGREVARAVDRDGLAAQPFA